MGDELVLFVVSCYLLELLIVSKCWGVDTTVFLCLNLCVRFGGV